MLSQKNIKITVRMFFFLLLILNYKYSIGFDDLNSIQLEEKNIESLEKGIFYWGKDYWGKEISSWQKEDGSNLKLRRSKNGISYIYKEQTEIAHIKRINQKSRNILSFHLAYVFTSSYEFINNKNILIEIKEFKEKPAEIRIKNADNHKIIFMNLYPKYDYRKEGYTLDFYERVNKSSSKNTIIVPYSEKKMWEKSEILMMCGFNNNDFILDYDPWRMDDVLAFSIAYALQHMVEDDS